MKDDDPASSEHNAPPHPDDDDVVEGDTEQDVRLPPAENGEEAPQPPDPIAPPPPAGDENAGQSGTAQTGPLPDIVDEEEDLFDKTRELAFKAAVLTKSGIGHAGRSLSKNRTLAYIENKFWDLVEGIRAAPKVIREEWRESDFGSFSRIIRNTWARGIGGKLALMCVVLAIAGVIWLITRGPNVKEVETKYPDGTVKSVEHFKKGKEGKMVKTGCHRTWYQGGELRSEEFYEDDRLHGTQTEWHDNGQKMWQCDYEEGIPHGTEQTWRKDGTRSTYREVEDGKLHGKSTVFWENGNTRVVTHFQRAVAHGQYASHWPNGNKRSEGQYKNGFMSGKWSRYTEEGKLQFTSKFDGRTGNPQGSDLLLDPDAGNSAKPGKQFRKTVWD